MAIFDKYKSRIDKFVSEPDNGRYDAMNKGIRLASGEYLNFMNAGDSYFYDDVLKDIFSDKTYDVGVLYGNLYMLSKNSYIQTIPLELTKEFFYIYSLGHPASFIHKSLFDKYGLYNDNLVIVSDYEKWLVFWKNGVAFEYIPYIVACFNCDGISSAQESQNLHKKERLKIIEKYFLKDELERLKKKYKKSLKKMFRPKYSFWEQIFSVKNEDDDNNGKYKVIAIL